MDVKICVFLWGLLRLRGWLIFEEVDVLLCLVGRFSLDLGFFLNRSYLIGY